MSKRPFKRSVLRRKRIVPGCPIDDLVVSILKEYTCGSAEGVYGVELDRKVVNMIRKDVMDSRPDLINGAEEADYTVL